MDREFVNKEIIFEHLKRNNDCNYANEIYLIIRNIGFLRISTQRLGYIGIGIYFFLSTVLSGLLLLFNLLYQQKINYNNEVAIARVSREKDKIENVCGEIQFVGDDIKNRDLTVYRIGSRYERLLFLIKFYVRFCLREYMRIKEILNNEELSPYTSKILLWCVKRIPHTVIFKNAIENIMTNYNLSTVYIGATHERFALIVEELSRKYNKRLICIPHGVETTDKMPGGYVGDVFYCSSFDMASRLNLLYDSSKFIFDSNVTNQMYQIKETYIHTELNREKRVVFFTQPIYIEQSKEIIIKIAKYLKFKNQKLYIKVHPNENPSGYNIANTELIADFNESIIGNICISVLSTILLEAIYNDSNSISIIHLVSDSIELTGDSEFLNDKRIYKPKDEKALIDLIDNLYN